MHSETKSPIEHIESGTVSAYFQLRPIKAAKVSEISEATASSSIPPEERVNLHIGNPVQEKRLTSAYLRMALGIDIRREELSEERKQEILDEVEWNETDLSKLDFLIDLIQKAGPYMPRGGFNRAKPNYLVKVFHEWLLNQQEPLTYDLGQSSGKREIILACGGINECLRVLFHTLSTQLIRQPARILLFHVSVPDYLLSFPSLSYLQLPDDEKEAAARIAELLQEANSGPCFLLLGKICGEETRRFLRHLSIERPLFFIEVNDAPNHLSLAREAKLANRVLRFLTPGIFSPFLDNLSTIFVAGPADFLSVFETIHFQLKSSPSATEVEALSYILEQKLLPPDVEENSAAITVDPPYEGLALGIRGEKSLPSHAQQVERVLTEIIDSTQKLIDQKMSKLSRQTENITRKINALSSIPTIDRFSKLSTKELLEELISNINSPEWNDALIESFANVFTKHHPEYELQRCVVVSGSSRTALSLLGFHCGIEEVVIPDLSWTYEHCFPKVDVIPLTPSFDLDADGIITAVSQKLAADPLWNTKGAVVINNPHNATGQIFNESEVQRLVKWLLDRNVFIVDDLSYQNVAPSSHLPAIKTIRQITDGLIAAGYLSREQTQWVITIHSLSKTDCFAGARISVAEILQEELYKNYLNIIKSIRPNITAVLLAYLFYRNDNETANAYWRLRNQFFLERSEALLEAVRNLPKDRNPFDITITPPVGSMYPLMVIHQLPAGLSLEWLASGLARQGIGLIPLSTFARTEKGFETGRKTFRLTLGGTDGAPILLKKVRHVLIDLNRLIAEEAANYNRKKISDPVWHGGQRQVEAYDRERWHVVEEQVRQECARLFSRPANTIRGELRDPIYLKKWRDEFVPERLKLFKQRYDDRVILAKEMMEEALADDGKRLAEILQKEFYKDNLSVRERMFHQRMYDRTVHPTQMYSIQTELIFERIIHDLLRDHKIVPSIIESASKELLREYFGLNVAIQSSEESKEMLLDLDTIIAAESYINPGADTKQRSFLSFWGDWDGSNRPSGQGHQLVAAVVIENVTRLSRILKILIERDRSLKVEPDLLNEVEKLDVNSRRFSQLLNEITHLTHQLERRYRGILPFNVKPSALRQIGMNLHLARDPLTLLWYHNDRLERKMLDLRAHRKKTLEYYFSLNKRLRKQLYALIPAIQKHIKDPEVLIEASLYRDLLQRIIITPRIHQKMITAQDQFAIDTTVYNIHEINEITGKYGNPGMVLGLQVSMASKPEALISLDRKMLARREQAQRGNPDLALPTVRLIPLFEDLSAVRNLTGYLNKVWEYCLQSRRINQETKDRFAEMVAEIFIAGSDLSQQVGQAAGAQAYRQAKCDLALWLAERRLAEEVRIKMGSGEPMQRQGGYYAEVSGEPAFLKSPESGNRFSKYLRESTRKSTEYATTPLMGVFAGGDLRTFQSTISERLRYLPVKDLAQLLYHVKEAQRIHTSDLVRASESFIDTRLQSTKRGSQELERLTIGGKEKVFDEFLALFTENFRQILYGREEDVVGIHVIAYFIARTTPPLRDRPTVRPSHGSAGERGQKIIEKIAETIPFARYGSLLRAIAHNQAQTAVLGINQLTTGLFRALDGFSQKEFAEGDAQTLIAERILPYLPVYEILHTLRIYQDVELHHLQRIERAFPAGNSAFLALREDNDAMSKYIVCFQQELLRRHGIDMSDFFEGDRFIPDLLPTLRPDLAVLLQPDLFNTSIENLLSVIKEHGSDQWVHDVEMLLKVPEEIKKWRSKAWEILEQPVFHRIQSFTELAVALHSLSSTMQAKELPMGSRGIKLSSDLSNFFRMSNADDEMRQFLAASLDYLSAVSGGMMEVPINIIRAMKEVERIAKIEEQALTPQEQDMLRFYILEIARLAGENG